MDEVYFVVTDKIAYAIDKANLSPDLDNCDKEFLSECKMKKHIPFSYIEKLSVHLKQLSHQNEQDVNTKWINEILEGSEFWIPPLERKEKVKKSIECLLEFIILI